MRRNAWLGAAPIAAVAVGLAFTGSASAQSGNPFGCTAGTASATLLTNNLLPAATTANTSNVPCADDSATLGQTTVSSIPGLSLSLGPISAKTKLGASMVTGSTVYTGAMSTSTVDAVNLDLAGLSIGLTTPSQAKVDYECVNNRLVAHATSTLNAITINGVTTTLNGLSQNLSIPGVATILANQHTSTATSDTETLLHVQLVGAVGNGVTLDVGSATASMTSGGCAGTASATGGGGTGTGTGGGGTGGGSGHGGSGSGGGRGTGGGGTGTGTGTGGGTGAGGSAPSGPCPAGSTLHSGTCVISGTKVTVPLTKSVQITGGTVMTLAAAKRKYGKHTACLNGAGPNWIVVGTARANKITVGKTRMRVMGLGGNDHITVKGGNRTCVNGGAGNDVIVNKQSNYVTAFGANGTDTITLGNGPGFVLGGQGNDHIVAGKGKVNLQGNWGNDYIKAGNGPANLNGGAGNDTLVAGTGRAHLNGGPGRNRLTAHGKTAFVMAQKGSKSVAYVRAGNAKYARRHDVAAVHVIKK